jgi:hypothetical protein
MEVQFSQIEKSSFSSIYINEVWAVANSIGSLNDRLNNDETILKMNESLIAGTNCSSPSSEPHELISAILGHASRLDKLFKSSNQRDGEPKDSYEFRKTRSKFLRKSLLPKKRETHEIFKTGVRNSIEHFDERADLLCHRIIERHHDICTKAILYNMTISSKRVFMKWSDVIPFKVYIVDSSEYVMLDHEFNNHVINISVIVDEAHQIAAKCKLLAKEKPDSNGNVVENPFGLISTPPNMIR